MSANGGIHAGNCLLGKEMSANGGIHANGTITTEIYYKTENTVCGRPFREKSWNAAIRCCVPS
jgi:hypothetical protein